MRTSCARVRLCDSAEVQMDRPVLGLASNSLMFPKWTSQFWGQGRSGAGLKAQNTFSLAAFITPQHPDGRRLRRATCLSFFLPSYTLFSSVFGGFFWSSLVPLLERNISLFYAPQCPPVLSAILQSISEQDHCLCSQPFFFLPFSIVSRSLRSSLSNNRLFIFTLMRVLLWTLQTHKKFL